MKYQCYVFLLLLLLTGCNKEEVIKEKDKKVTLSVSSVYAKRNNQLNTKPDNKAKVFVFYDCVAEDFFNCDIHEDGTVTKKDSLIMNANIKGITNIDGNVVFEIEKKDSYYMVFVMSNRCYGKIMGNYHRDSEKSAKMTFRFLID